MNQTKLTLGVIGSRAYSNKPKFLRTLATTIKELGGPEAVRILTGGAAGPDSWAVDYAKANGIEFKVYPARWKIEGGKVNYNAGLMRNSLIVHDSDYVLAYYDGESNGTYDSLFKCDWSDTPYEVIGEE